ncbi:MAG: alpha/beta hydrolase, partial [Clostridiales bacterium]|nr:alpha/beta hydrolase [Candidatus Blautia equi]
FDVYIVEHCGHGKSYRLLESEPCKVYVDTYQRYVRDLLKVAALAKKENPELPLTLFGHSMGGGIAGVAAGRKPKWFDRVILSSPMIPPQTGGIPWGIAKALAHIACFFGRGKSWVFGHGPYKGLENFDTSASASRARFDYYQAYKNREATAQLSGATYGWIRAAAGIHRELMRKTIHRLHMPLLLVQAGSDQSVRNDAQDLFIELLQKDPDSDARMVQIPCSKHEIFNSPDEVYAGYLREIFRFCSLR